MSMFSLLSIYWRATTAAAQVIMIIRNFPRTADMDGDRAAVFLEFSGNIRPKRFEVAPLPTRQRTEPKHSCYRALPCPSGTEYCRSDHHGDKVTARRPRSMVNFASKNNLTFLISQKERGSSA